MGALTSYAIQVAIVLIVEYLVYKLLLSSTTLYRFNRMVIMCCYIVALVAVPLMHMYVNGSDGTVKGGAISFDSPTATVAVGGSREIIWSLVPIVYFGGMVGMALWTLFSYVRLFKIISKGRRLQCGRYTLVVLDRDISPFSWGCYVIVSQADADNSMIISHEIAHIRRHHILDLFVAQLFVTFNWFNPAAYLMRDELSAVQEYEADEQVLASGVNPRDYQMLLIKKTAGAGFQAIANSLNHSQLKNRLTMMMKTKSKSARRLMAAVMLPAAIAAASLTDIPAVAGVIHNVGTVSYGKGSENLSDSQKARSDSATTLSGSQVCENPDVPPVYKGGETAMYTALMESIHYPKDAAEAKAQGRTTVGFIVNTDGRISDVEVLKSSGNASLDAEAVRVIKDKLSTDWTPGQLDGKAVACKCQFPVVFRLN